VPARLLARELGVKDMYCLTVKKRGDERHVTTDITDDISGKHVLLVEDMLESGKSLAMAREYLGDKGASVKTACLYTMPATECKPDYSLREVDEVVEFPWE
jgi:hypoxanthine phosphoribosyltransferase